MSAALTRQDLPWWLGALGALLVAPSLLIGFHLDDHLHRFLYSSSPEGARLLAAYASPFGIANGDPTSMHWQIEQGYAPWWTPPDLLLTPFRPLSELSHRLDAALWPDSALLMHLHSVLWYAALCVATSWLFGALCGRRSVLGGLCALLYAIDYTHGFAVGWIANRNAVIAACLGVLALFVYVEGRRRDSLGVSFASGALLLCALGAGEASIAVVGYVFAHALCLDRGPLARRALALAPTLLALGAWRVLYAASGAGARGSGLYLDPAREPLRFALAALERIPLLVFGEFATPPAESPLFVPPALGMAMLVCALALCVWLVLATLPLVRHDPLARFFALGMAASLVPACATVPHSRLLYFVSLGAMGLLARLWYGVVEAEQWVPRSRVGRALSHGFAALFMGFHLLVSPVLLPIMACSVALGGAIQRGVESALAAAPGRDLVVVAAPEYFYVKLIPMQNGLADRPGPRRLRALSFGAVPIEIRRSDAATLELRFPGGLLREPLLELYRAADDPLPIGTRVELEGLTIEVTAHTDDARILATRFVFDRSLDDPQFHFVTWDGERFARYRPPAVGERDRLAPAKLRLGL